MIFYLHFLVQILPFSWEISPSTCSLCISNFLEGISAVAAKLLQLCPTLCDPTDGSPSGSTVPGILQARTLEWLAISFSDA